KRRIRCCILCETRGLFYPGPLLKASPGLKSIKLCQSALPLEVCSVQVVNLALPGCRQALRICCNYVVKNSMGGRRCYARFGVVVHLSCISGKACLGS